MSVPHRKVSSVSGLVSRAEARRVAALGTLDEARQASLGQFFTPARAAELIAAMATLPRGGTVRILDPGAGAGSLTAALVARFLDESPGVEIEVMAVEIDERVVPFLAETLDDCKQTAAKRGVRLTSQVVVGDFIAGSTGLLERVPALEGPFDVVVMNPPYAKLGLSSVHRQALQVEGVDCPNLYAAFLALGAAALRDGGQLVAITPRSFANGVYFEGFRRHLLAAVSLDRIHTFESRSTVFADTGVLQENVVFAATKGGSRRRVTLSSSRGHTDDVASRQVPYDVVVHPDDARQFIRITTDDGAPTIAGLPGRLSDLGVTASTGKVVDFRVRDWLVEAGAADAVPLVYPGNIRGGVVEWPREIRKAQGFVSADLRARALLVPSGHYVVIKRFSAKEERRRVVAAVWDPAVNGDWPVAFENHLNVLHAGGHGLDSDLAVGLSLWLNSTPLDDYFRTFSGHTQVNATDLRTLPFPPVNALRRMGAGRASKLPAQDEIDALVATLIPGLEKAA